MGEEEGVEVFIALGSNLGDRRANLEGAVAALARSPAFTLVRVSPWIETEPVGGPPGARRYLNGALQGRWRGSPPALLALLFATEEAFGRRRARGERNAPRTLDLDLLLYGSARIDSARLTVPHPRMTQRAFVLVPLAEIAPDTVSAEQLEAVRHQAIERLGELLVSSPSGRGLG